MSDDDAPETDARSTPAGGDDDPVAGAHPDGATAVSTPDPTHGELTEQSDSSVARWVLLSGDRHLIVAGLLLAMATLAVVLLATDVADVRNAGAFTRLFSALVGGNLTLITVAITINQLILSREFAAPSELRERIEDTLEYRHAVEETAGEPVSPVTPDAFLDFLARELQERASALRHATEPPATRGVLRDEVEQYTATLVAEGDRMRVTLEAHGDHPFQALLTVLDADFTLELYGAERLRSVYVDELPPEALEALDDVVELLEYLGVGRQYFKTLYLQRELADLSRRLFLVGLPAIASSIAAVWLYGGPDGALLDGRALEAAVLLATVVATAPLAVLVAHVLRITTVTRRTASLMPFTIREDTPL